MGVICWLQVCPKYPALGEGVTTYSQTPEEAWSHTRHP